MLSLQACCKRLWYVFFLFLGLSNGLRSQNIPDDNFAFAIRIACPTCIDSNDNLLAPAQNITLLDMRLKAITDLTGIEGFTNLRTLYLGENLLTVLPSLPPKLTYLDCEGNQLTTLPALPSSIFNLYCNNNQLTSLPALPSGLAYINVSKNKLVNLPTLPTSLKVLDCFNNLLIALPELPKSIQSLNCSNNQITCLPLIPASLQTFVYSGNSITCFPNKTNLNRPLSVCGLPDANFTLAIRDVCPECLDACFRLVKSVVDTLTSLNISNHNITDLTGINTFKSLKSLNCSKNQLICLPSLPLTLTTLQLDADKISCIPNGNANLKVYDASGTLITTLAACDRFIPDENFAQAIRYQCPTCIDDCNKLLPYVQTVTSLNLNLSNFKIKDLTGIEWFTSLQYLDCLNNQLTFLPALPRGLIILNCDNNSLTSLPQLPLGLSVLRCENNQLEELPPLPSRLTNLFCSNNRLRAIPTLPSNLLVLACNNNKITQLPVLPSSLTGLFCRKNNLITLPSLPSKLNALNCLENSLTCLPMLPSSLVQLWFDMDKIKCSPNTVSGLTIYDINNTAVPAPPLCPASVVHSSGTIPSGNYVAMQTVESGVTISSGITSYHASQSIVLKPGFQAVNNTTFSAEIRKCN